jgi:predicted Zn-dependent peptidase
MEELSFGCWSYGHPVIGYWDDLESAQLDDVTLFHRRWYRPDNAILTVAGDVDADRCLQTIEAWFGDIAAGGDRALPDVAQAPRSGPVEEIIHDSKARLPAVLFNHPAPACNHADFFAWELLETVLYSGTSSRLYRRMVVDEANAVQVGGGYDGRRGVGLFSGSFVAPAGADLDTLVHSFDSEVGRMVRDGLPLEELEKARNQLRASRVFGLESVLNRALSMGHGLLFHGAPDWADRYLEGIDAVAADQVVALAGTLDPSERVCLKVMP